MTSFSKLMLTAVLVAAAGMAITANAQVEVGDPAPEFSLAGSDGNTHNLAELRGKYVVVAFFPKAFTKG